MRVDVNKSRVDIVDYYRNTLCAVGPLNATVGGATVGCSLRNKIRTAICDFAFAQRDRVGFDRYSD
jgi:hypothetical protein